MSAPLLEIRVGSVEKPDFYHEIGINWPEKEYSSAFMKYIVDSVQVTEYGLAGNGIGYPTHIDNAQYRSVLVFNELQWQVIDEKLPGILDKLRRGSFGENFIVNHPSFLSSEVCIGDIYEIGTATFRVTGPRMPCPKVDAFNHTTGMTALTRQHGWAGYFLQVIQPGECHIGDMIQLKSREFPGFTIQKVAEGLWDNSFEFLNTLANMECLFLDISEKRQLQDYNDCILSKYRKRK
jgi:MOSC domain-containing protein YiiM